MGRNGCLALAFGLLLALGMIGPDFSADARPAVWSVSSNSYGDSPRDSFDAEATTGFYQGAESPLNVSGDSALPLFEAAPALSQIATSPLNLSGNSVGQDFEAPMEHKSGEKAEDEVLLSLERLPGFDIMNKMTSNEVLVQCVDSGYPDPPTVVNKDIPVGELDTWNLQDLDPFQIHIEYKCYFLLSGIYPPKHMIAVVWADSNHRADEPFSCIHCQYQVSNDGLWMIPPGWTHFFKVQDWQPFSVNLDFEKHL